MQRRARIHTHTHPSVQSGRTAHTQSDMHPFVQICTHMHGQRTLLHIVIMACMQATVHAHLHTLAVNTMQTFMCADAPRGWYTHIASKRNVYMHGTRYACTSAYAYADSRVRSGAYRHTTIHTFGGSHTRTFNLRDGRTC